MTDASGPGDRGLAPVVGKALEIGIVVVFVGMLASTLYGGVVPEYRATAGDRLADRTLAAAAHDVEAAVPAGSVRTAPGTGTETVDGSSATDRSGPIVANGTVGRGAPAASALGFVVHDRVTLPDEIRGRSYQLRTVGDALVLDHPNPRIGGRQSLAVPGTVVDVRGSWNSTDRAFVRVRLTAAGTVVELGEGSP